MSVFTEHLRYKTDKIEKSIILNQEYSYGSRTCVQYAYRMVINSVMCVIAV